MPTDFSRRSVLLGLGAAGLAAGTPGGTLAQNAFAELDGKTWFFLSDAEARFLATACDVLIPEDDYPSASQAGVVDFIDMQLAGPYGRGGGLYMKGPFGDGTPEQGYQIAMTPDALFRIGIERLNSAGSIADMDAAAREDVITRLSKGETDMGDIPAKTFFGELHALTNEGYFADPIYGGNKDYAGWKMVGFPGAHAYFLDFVEKNAPYRAPPMGIAHAPGSTRAGVVPQPDQQKDI